MSDREWYRSIGEHIVDPRILSHAIEGIDDPPSHPINRINLLFAPPSRATSRNSCPSATRDDFHPISSISPSSPTSLTPIINHTISSPNHDVNASASSAHNVVGDVVPNSCDACAEGTESSNSFTLSVLRPTSTGFSISPQPAGQSIHNVCSHPSQGVGHPGLPHHVRSSQSSNHSAMQAPSTILATDSAGCWPGTASGMGHHESEDFTSTSPSTGAPSPRLHERVIADTASYHTFSRLSDVIGSTKASSSPPPARRPSRSVPIATSRSGSCANIHTIELCRDDNVEFGHHDNGSFDANPSGDGRYNEEHHRAECGPPVGLLSASIDSPPGASASAPLGDEDDSTGSICPVTFFRHSGTSYDTSSLHSVQAGQKQAGEAGNVYGDFNLAYILPEGSIRSFDSRLSFVQGHSGRPLSSHISSTVPFAISERSLSIEDPFLRHLRKYDKTFDSRRHYWSFTRVKGDPSMSSNPSKRTQPPSHPHLSDTDQAQTDMSSRVQETWRCGHVGRFRVGRTVSEPRPADPAKGVVQQIHVRQIMDQRATNGYHSVIHKHPRAIAFSIFRTSNPFAGGKPGEVSTSTAPTHMNIRAGIMLAPKKVQQKYAITKSTSQLGTRGDSRDLNKGPSAAPYDCKGRGRDNSDWGEPSSVTSTRHPSNRASQFPRTGSARESAPGPILSTPSRFHLENHASNVFEYDRSAIPLAPLPRSIEPSRPDANLGSTFTERFFRVVRGSSRTDTPSPSLAGMLQSMISPSRSPQEEIDLVNNLNASFKAVGLLPSKTGQPSPSPLERGSDHTFLGQIPEGCLCMTLPLWARETGGVNIQAQATDVASPTSVPANGRFLIVYYVPIEEVGSQGENGKKPKKEADFKSVHLPAFRVVARIIDQSELLQSGLKVPSGGLAVDSPEEAVGSSDPHQKGELKNTVVCYCYGRERGFDFVEDGLCQLGLCTQEDQIQHFPVAEEEEQEGEISLTPIGKVVVEIIWLGCLAVTSSGPV